MPPVAEREPRQRPADQRDDDRLAESLRRALGRTDDPEMRAWLLALLGDDQREDRGGVTEQPIG
jgi:hypothetical protein